MIETLLGQQGSMGPFLDDFTLVQDQDAIGALNGAQSMLLALLILFVMLNQNL